MNASVSSHHNRESGQVLAFVAVLMVVLLAMLALVLDGGNLYLHRRRMQNAADAGAIAGARILCLEGTDITDPEAWAAAHAAAQDYSIVRNQADAADITVDGWTVTVVAHKDVPMTFARIIGINQIEVSALATAMCGPAGVANGLAPIAVEDDFCVPGTTAIIWDVDAEMVEEGNISGENRGWLDLSCYWPDTCNAGTAELSDWMIDGYTGPVFTETWVPSAGGAKVAVWMIPDVGDTLLMPCYGSFQKIDNRDYYYITTFAKFDISGIVTDPPNRGIQGTFTGFVEPSFIRDGPDGGVRTVALIR